MFVFRIFIPNAMITTISGVYMHTRSAAKHHTFERRLRSSARKHRRWDSGGKSSSLLRPLAAVSSVFDWYTRDWCIAYVYIYLSYVFALHTVARVKRVRALAHTVHKHDINFIMKIEWWALCLCNSRSPSACGLRDHAREFARAVFAV